MTIEPTPDARAAKRAPASPSPRLHRAAHVEDSVHAVFDRRLRQRGWQVVIVAYTGYGAPGWARVMARVALAPPGPSQPSQPDQPSGPDQPDQPSQPDQQDQPDQPDQPGYHGNKGRPAKVRGWRSFLTLPVKNTPVTIEVGDSRHETRTDRGGYIDCVVEGDLSPDWATVRLSTAGGEPVDAPVRVVDPSVRFGVLSDIDDTIMVTALPRPLLAAWNTFVLDEHARMAVPGMAVLYERLTNAHPSAPVLYLSTGAWNVAPTLTRFLSRHLYPAGPLLLTDWGPTQERWFRSGREHKRNTLVRLAKEFPNIQWLLIGDDGQHDPEIYSEFAAAHPDNVAAVAIRRLSPTQAVLSGSLPAPSDASTSVDTDGQQWLWAPDGAGLWRLLEEAGLV